VHKVIKLQLNHVYELNALQIQSYTHSQWLNSKD